MRSLRLLFVASIVLGAACVDSPNSRAEGVIVGASEDTQLWLGWPAHDGDGEDDELAIDGALPVPGGRFDPAVVEELEVTPDLETCAQADEDSTDDEGTPSEGLAVAVLIAADFTSSPDHPASRPARIAFDDLPTATLGMAQSHFAVFATHPYDRDMLFTAPFQTAVPEGLSLMRVVPCDLPTFESCVRFDELPDFCLAPIAEDERILLTPW